MIDRWCYKTLDTSEVSPHPDSVKRIALYKSSLYPHTVLRILLF